MKVKIRYFAQLRDQACTDQEVLETDARTPGELYEILKVRHGFTLNPGLVRAAVNDEFCPWDHPLEADNLVVFIPPVAGG